MDPVYFDKLIDDVKGSGDAMPALFAAIARGDFDSMTQYPTEDAELVSAGFPRLDGAWSAREAVIGATRYNFGLIAEQRPVIDRQITSGDSTALLLRESGVRKDSRLPYSIRVSMWVTMRDGKVCRVEEIAAPCE